MARQILPTVSVVTSASFQELRSKSDVVVVGYFASDDTFSHDAFTSVAEAMHEDYVFGITSDDTLAAREQINIPGIALYKTFDEEKNTFGPSHNVQAISTFIRAAGKPLTPEFHPEVYNRYVDVSLGHFEKPTTRAKYVLLDRASTWLHSCRECRRARSTS
jgi:protein disulfide-isomerase A1